VTPLLNLSKMENRGQLIEIIEIRSARNSYAFADEWTHSRNMGDRHGEGPHQLVVVVRPVQT
jgi:hypothetical protein